AVDRHAPRTRQRHLVRRRYVDLRLTRLRRVGPELDTYELCILGADSRAPQASVDWVDRVPVASKRDSMILLRIDRFTGLGPLGDLAVAVGVEHSRAPSLRRLRIVGFVVRHGVDPADGVV